MQLAAKHAGTPDTCPVCVLPDDQFAAREAIWAHALALFADQSGVDVELVHHDDRVVMVKAWAAASVVARQDMLLHRELPVSTPGRPVVRYERRSHRKAVGLLLAVFFVLLAICSSIWSYL